MARIAFVQNMAIQYLGIMYLSSLLKRTGHTVDVFIVGRDEDKAVREITSFKPDIVGFSLTTGNHQWALSFSKLL